MAQLNITLETELLHVLFTKDSKTVDCKFNCRT